MANIHRKPLRATVPNCVKQLARFPDSKRRRAAKNLPWSRMSESARIVALAVIAIGQRALEGMQ